MTFSLGKTVSLSYVGVYINTVHKMYICRMIWFGVKFPGENLMKKFVVSLSYNIINWSVSFICTWRMSKSICMKDIQVEENLFVFNLAGLARLIKILRQRQVWEFNHRNRFVDTTSALFLYISMHTYLFIGESTNMNDSTTPLRDCSPILNI